MKRLLIASMLIAATATPAMAGVGKVSTPKVTKGEAEVEYNATRTGDGGKSLNNAQKHKIEFEYGITDDWMLGLEFEARRTVPTHTELKGYGLETQYELTQQGEWWLSSAIKGEYLHADNSQDADEGELVFIGQRDIGKARITGNVSLEREIGSHRSGGTSLSSALQGLYRCNRFANPGVEWHAEYGRANDFSASERQEHYLGPIVKGELLDLGTGEIGYEAGYYWGLTHASANNAQRIKIAYEIKF